MIHKVILMLLLVVVSNNAMAQWTEFQSDLASTTYIKLDNIRRNGNFAKMWIMEDYKSAKINDRRKSFKSVKMLLEFDCLEEQFRVINWIEYAGHKGTGETIFSEPSISSWNPVVPDSISELQMKMLVKNINPSYSPL